MEKLRIMLHFYDHNDFQRVKFFRLNSDQILQFLACPKFVGPGAVAPQTKVIESLKMVQKARELNLFKRPEILAAVKHMATDLTQLAQLQPQTYVTSLIHSTAKMQIDDAEVWNSLASYVAQRYENFDTRNLSNIVYSFYRISASQPILLNFDILFQELELPIIMKLDQGDSDP